ncbi:MAG: DEAD/DEAH box helicase [Treponema sp.]|nr:DEAD/DEAH box helicase [Treponema sp.]
MGSNFSRLDKRLREYIYEKKWPSLKPVQEAAIPVILDTNNHILIAADTAAGKTEACFFPIITLLLNQKKSSQQSGHLPPGDSSPPGEYQPPGIQVIYIGPLKALINDQFERLLPMLAALDINLWRWHGDVEMTHKKKLLDNPSGILQITPESLEALILGHPEKIKYLFGSLQFAVIDEVHAFIGTDRGSQLICLLERIRLMTESAQTSGSPVRRVGLSATLGNYSTALGWLAAGTACSTSLITGADPAGKGRRLSLAVDCCSGNDESYYRAIYDQCRPGINSGGINAAGINAAGIKKCIIFTNSRLEAEQTTAALKRIAAQRGEQDYYQVHHGSIAADLREETERNLRRTEEPQVIAATATLEMGMDIGSLDRIIQTGAPSGVSAFIQRLGRSGRRGGVSQMYFCSRAAAAPAPAAAGPEQIPWTLIKTIAIIQLYIEEQWSEDADPRPLVFSLLFQQTLALLGSMGEQGEQELCEKILSMPPFAQIKERDYLELLGCLEANDYIEKTEEGKYIAGLEGGRIISHFSFYSVFPDEQVFRVTYMGREIGRVNFIPPQASVLALGGKTWTAENVNLSGREIAVVPGGKQGSFLNGSNNDSDSDDMARDNIAKIWRGGADGHHIKVAERMRQVLLENKQYPYLTAGAAACLRGGRDYAGKTGLGSSIFLPVQQIKTPVYQTETAESGVQVPKNGSKNETKKVSKNIFYILPWLGSRGMRTMRLLMQKKENKKILKITRQENINPYIFRITSGLEINEFGNELNKIILSAAGAETLVKADQIPYTDKYDYLLPPNFMVKQYAANMLSMEELKKLVTVPAEF